MPLILGRGAPPVTKDDLISISSAHRLLSSQKIQAPHSTPQSEPTSLMLETENAMLKKLYREAMLEIATLRDAKNRVQ